jgi:hypothetical protein
MHAKAAIFLFTGPDKPCRLVHSIVFARDIIGRGGQASIILEGEAPAWLLELPDPQHKHHALYSKAKDEGLLDVVCRGCALQAGVVDVAEREGFTLVSDASGHVSLVPYMESGFRIVTL